MTVALDDRGVTQSTFSALQAEISNLKIQPGYSLLQEIRTIKTSDEVERIRKATRITEEAMEVALAEAHIGITEEEMEKLFNITVIQKGGTPLFAVIGFGDHSALANSVPSSRTLQNGDIIKIDAGCRFKGYCADIARTVVFGAASSKQLNYYQAVLEGENQAINLLRPGVSAGEIYAVALDAVRRSGIPHYRRHHVGHGIGIEGYDPPLLSPNNNMLLEPGMVINVETPYYELGFGGVTVEDTMVITEDGFQFLTESSRELRVLT
jgi:Xaa-Pro aminopeptidase